MMKQIITAGAMLFMAVEMSHAACVTDAEEQKFKATIEKADKIKDQVDDSKSSYKHGTFKGELDLFKSTLEKASAPTSKVGPLCEAYKKTLVSTTTKLQDRAKSSNLTME